MPTLLGLPRELRDEIILLVLLTPPSLPNNAERKASNYPYASVYANRIHYLVSEINYRPTALGLLLTCHQLCAETQNAISRSRLVFNVDLAIVNECWLWPTWRFISTKTHPCLDRMNINLQLCCTPEDRAFQTGFSERHERSSFRVDPIIQTLCGFLQRFLSLGAASNITTRMETGLMKNNREFKRDLRIRRLHVNVCTTPPKDERLSHEQVPGRVIDGLKHLTNDPLYAADGIASRDLLGWLIDQIYHLLVWTPDAPASSLLFGRVGTIVYCLDGTIAQELNLSALLTSEFERVPTEVYMERKRKAREKLGLV